MSWRQHSPHGVLSQNTNVHPAFGNEYKIKRNRALTSTIMNLNYGKRIIGQGVKPSETLNDPHHRKPEHIIALGRQEMSIAGRRRGQIVAANPGMVQWKNPYYRAQRPPVRKPIGPFTQGSLEKQSILYRISDTFANLGGKINNG